MKERSLAISCILFILFLGLPVLAQTVKPTPSKRSIVAKPQPQEVKQQPQAIKIGPDNFEANAYQIWLTYYQAQQEGKEIARPKLTIAKRIGAKEEQRVKEIWEQGQSKARLEVFAKGSYEIWAQWYKGELEGKQEPMPRLTIGDEIDAKEADQVSAIWQEAKKKAYSNIQLEQAANSILENQQQQLKALPFSYKNSLPRSASAPTISMSGAGNSGIRQQFTGKERDAETGLDYFGARYYASTQGRFISPDPLDYHFASPEEKLEILTNPQRWNKYPYALNNPLRYVDPDGQAPQEGAGTTQDRDIRDLLAGRITREEFRTRINARAAGAAIGLSPYLGLRAGASILSLIRSNPATVQQLGNELVEMATGGPGSGTPSPLSSSFRASEETLLSGTFLKGEVGGTTVTAAFSKVGDTLYTAIAGAYKESKGLSKGSDLIKLVDQAQDFAKQKGLARIEVQAINVTNLSLIKKLTKEGFKKTTVTVGGETYSAYVKTITIKK